MNVLASVLLIVFTWDDYNKTFLIYENKASTMRKINPCNLFMAVDEHDTCKTSLDLEIPKDYGNGYSV